MLIAVAVFLEVAGRSSAQTVPVAPGAPTVSVPNAGTNALTVTWTAPTDTGSSAISAYDLRYIETAATEAEKADDANWTVEGGVWTSGALSYGLTGLDDGTGYDVQMRAANADGAGAWSDTATGTTTDHSGTTSGATILALDSAVPGRIDPAEDSDVFRIVLTESADLWVYTTGDLSTSGELLDVFDAELESNDGGYIPPNAQNFSIRAQLSAGTYYVKVRGFLAYQTGSYVLHVEAVTQPGDSVATATIVALDSLAHGWLDAGTEHFFKIELTASTDLWLLSIGETDTKGTLLGSSQTVLAENDDSKLINNVAGFTIRTQRGAGTYYVKVTGGTADSSGPYTLSVRSVTDPGDSTATAKHLGFRLPTAGRLSSSSDDDYFELALPVATYVVLVGVSYDGSTSLTPTVFDDQDVDQDIYTIANSVWAADGHPERAFWAHGRLPAGTYYIRINSDSGDHGPYMIHALLSAGETNLEERCSSAASSSGAPQDPLYGCQWHLENSRLFPGGAGLDINAEAAWTVTKGATSDGEGVHVVVVDNELDYRHDDLKDRVLTQYNHSYFSDDVRDPSENYRSHGTSVAGIIAASENGVGGVGVAPEANVYGYALIDSGADDDDTESILLTNEAAAMTANLDVTAVSNNSWGVGGAGLLAFAPAAWELAVERGAREGYGGLGTVYVFAAGNSAGRDHGNLDERDNHYAVMAACAINYEDERALYSEPGANLWVCAPSGDYGLPGITTTANRNVYTPTFAGTSASAPIVSGVAALVRAANPDLTWRDVKLILAGSARKNDPSDSLWRTAGYRYGSTTQRYSFSHLYGFGAVDAKAAVDLAADWTNVPMLREISGTSDEPLRIPDASGNLSGALVTSSITLGSHVKFTEFIAVEITMDHSWYRDLRIELVSPSGNTSILATSGLFFSVGDQGLHGTFRLGSARHLGEDAAGVWTLKLWDEQPLDAGVLRSWKLTAYGHGFTPFAPEVTSATAGSGSVTVGWTAPDETGGSAITSYDMRYIRSDALDKASSNWSVASSIWSSGALSYQRSGLSAGTYYDIQVRAVSSAGAGLWSESYQGATSAVTPSVPRNTLAEPRHTSLRVTWQPPSTGGVGVVQYDVRHIRSDAMDKADANWTTQTNAWTASSGGDLEYIIPSLVNDRQYDVQVRMVNALGASAWTSTVRATPIALNANPAFPISETGSRSIDENTQQLRHVGRRVEADDPDGDDLTYTLTGPDAGHFNIFPHSGQIITVLYELDHETEPTQTAVVNVRDGKDASGQPDNSIDDSITVTITVNDVNETPSIRDYRIVNVDEGTEGVFHTFDAGDPEDGPIKWTIEGVDAGAFLLDEDAGEISFLTTPDYESPLDASANNTYRVRLKAEERDGPFSNTRDFEIKVMDVNEVPIFTTDPPNLTNVVFPENETRPVATYSAFDPDDSTSSISFELDYSGDNTVFNLDEDSGVLTFKEPPDAEDPGDANTDNIYLISVTAYDILHGTSLDVAVTVDNVDEPPEVSGPDVVTIEENGATFVGSYTATDPEDAAVSWELLAGPDASHFEIAANGDLSFKSAPDYDARADANGDNAYEVAVGVRDTANQTDTVDVTVTITPVDEAPELTGPTHVTIEENSTTFVGSYSAIDPEGAAVSWELLAGLDASHFEIAANGDLRFKSAPDYDARADKTYEVTVRASDETGHTGTRAVIVTVTNVDEAPTITGEASIEFAENTTGTVGTYSASDPDGGTIVPSLSGPDADDFTFNSGVLSFRATPNYEAPTDAGRNNVYEVTVEAADVLTTVTLDVTITVTNEDEAGTLTLSSEQPQVGTPLTATLTDLDGDISGETWTWERLESGTWTPLSGATDPEYTPDDDDLNQRLRVSVTYTDGHGMGKSKREEADHPVDPLPVTPNNPPIFASSMMDRSVAENSGAGTAVGARMQATDADDDVLAYSLSDTNMDDDGLFTIDTSSGRIRVGAGTLLDFEDRNEYLVTVTAADPSNATASTTVTITVDDVNEPPIAADDRPATLEDTPRIVDVLDNDHDPEGDPLTVSLTQAPRAGTATLTPDNAFTYTPDPDTTGVDDFTYTVSDGSLTARALVYVTVTPVNDPPSFATQTPDRSVAQTARAGDRVGAPVAATDVDNEPLTLAYSLGGPSATFFEVEMHTGQITVAPGTVLDATTQRTHQVTVTAEDPDGATASIEVIITVTTGPVGPVIFGGGGGGGGPSGPIPSDFDFEWNVTADIEALDGDHGSATGMWSDGATLWIGENGSGADDAVYAYDRATGERAADREFELDDGNLAPRGLWSDGVTMWISDSGKNRLFAHDLASGERLPDSDLALPNDNGDPRGIWSFDSTMWVLDGHANALFAYDLESGELLAEYALHDDNDAPHGIWSDRVTVWVSDHNDKRLFAYRLPVPDAEEVDGEDLELERVTDEEFKELSKARNNSPRGLWSDGDVMYVVDASDARVYTYNMPDAIDARLASLTLSDVDVGEFSPGQTEYDGVASEGTTQTTVEVSAVQRRATVTIVPDDVDDMADGHQVLVSDGSEITIGVASEDESRTRVYHVRVGDPVDAGEAETAEPAPACLRGSVAAGFSFVVSGGGSVDDLEACAQNRNATAIYTLADGEWLSYVLGAPGFVNRSFRAFFADGLQADTPLLVRSEGPPSADPAGGAEVVTDSWPECLRGAITEGFSLVLSRGGSVDDLDACATDEGVTALYTLDEGVWVSYILDAPSFVNAAFRELHPDGLAPATPLLTRHDLPAPDSDGGEGDGNTAEDVP